MIESESKALVSVDTSKALVPATATLAALATASPPESPGTPRTTRLNIEAAREPDIDARTWRVDNTRHAFDPKAYQGDFNFAVDQIKVGFRHRKDLGDIDGLAQSIANIGLLSPITITGDGYLVCGARRLAAIRQLGWKRTRVHVRVDLSDRLRALVAQRDDDLHHKPFNPLEQAALYQELVALIAAEAARNYAATRFQAGDLHPRSRNRRSDGVGNLPTPSQQGKQIGRAKQQAANMIGGLGYRTLDKINVIKTVAADDAHSVRLRDEAGQALLAIRDGKPIDPLYRQIMELKTFDRLLAVVENPEMSQESRASASDAINVLKDSTIDFGSPGFNNIVTGAMNRVTHIENRIKRENLEETPASARERTRISKNFSKLWGMLHNWPTRFDPAVIADEVPDRQWELFEQTRTATNEFAEAVNRHRAELVAARDDAASAPAH